MQCPNKLSSHNNHARLCKVNKTKPQPARLRASGLTATTNTRHYALSSSLSLSLSACNDTLQSNWNSKLSMQTLCLPLAQPRHVRSLNEAQRGAVSRFLETTTSRLRHENARNRKGKTQRIRRAMAQVSSLGSLPFLEIKTWEKSPFSTNSGPFEGGKSAK